MLDCVYLFLLILLSPWLALKAWTTGKYRRGWAAKLLGRHDLPPATTDGPTVWLHGVSVGEIHLLSGLVAALLLSIFLLPTLYVWFARESDKLPEIETGFDENG